MAVYVYRAATGDLVSWCPNDADPVAPADALSAQGLVASPGLPALDTTHVWDAGTKTVVTVAAPTTPNWIATYQFVLLFTPAEHAAIAASGDQRVQQLMMAISVAQQINLNDPIVQGAIGYLVAVGLLTQANAALILSGQASQ